MIEAHAAWQRKVSGPLEPFTYRGKPYLTHMGQGLSFLDAAPWLSGRFIRCQAVEDCLLAELTPDGVPIDNVTSFDMRRGEQQVQPVQPVHKSSSSVSDLIMLCSTYLPMHMKNHCRSRCSLTLLLVGLVDW